MAEWLERYSASEESSHYSPGEEKEAPDYENMVSKATNLRDYLRWQVGLSDFNARRENHRRMDIGEYRRQRVSHIRS